MDKLRILFLTYQGDIAGSTNSISYLADGLARRGHEIFVGCRKESLLFSLLKDSPVHLIPMQFRSKFDRQNIRLIKETVDNYNIQLINAQSSKDRYTSIFAKLFFIKNVKLVHTRRQKPRGMNILKNMFLQYGADKMVVISEGLRDIFLREWFSKDFIEVIYNGIPVKRYEEWSQEKVLYYRDKFGIKEGDVVVGSVSRIKNQDQIVKAVAKLNDPSIKILFAGISEKDLHPKIKNVTIPNEIIYTGLIPVEDILNIYKLLDIKILSSTMDGFGLAILEAMAMGCPVIGTRFGGIKDVIVDGENGFLFDDGNINQLAGHIKELLNNRDLRQKFIAEGYKTALEKFTMEKTVDGYEKLFFKMIFS